MIRKPILKLLPIIYKPNYNDKNDEITHFNT